MAVWAAVISLPLACLTVIAEAVKTAPSVKPARTSVAVSSPGRLAATVALRSWLDSTPSPLPGGVILAWVGATKVPTPPAAPTSQNGANSAPTFAAEIDHFFVDAHGVTYEAGVEVATPAGSDPTVVGTPSLLPVTVGTTPPQGIPWSGINATTSVSGPVSQAVDGWAQAFTSGSASTLHLAVGDPNGSHDYVPLSGVSSVTATITAAAPAPQGPSGDIIAQVTLDIVWKSQSAASIAQSGPPPGMTMDLLIARANTAAPVVVAWGPPGSGPALRPYENGS